MLTQYIACGTDVSTLRAGLEKAVAAGAHWVEIKADSSVSDADISAIVKEFRPPLAELNAVLVLADRYELVPELEVDGVHLYDRSVPVSRVRTKLEAWPILGVSVQSADDVQALRGHDIDYIFLSPTFNADGTDALDTVTAISALLDQEVIEAPLVAAGGITPENAMKAVEAGARALAIDGSVADPAAFIKRFE